MSKELNTLIERALDGELDAAAVAALRQRLAEDPQARSAWWAEVSLRSQLGAVLGEEREQSARPRSTSLAGAQPRRGLRPRPRAPWRSPLPMWIASAAIVVLGLVAVLGSQPREQTLPDHAQPVAADPRVSGPAAGGPDASSPAGGGLRIVALRGGSANVGVGSVISPGTIISCTEDLELAADDGTVMTLSRGRLQLQSATGPRLHLAEGRLRLVVAKHPPGNPLRITTPHAEATIIGTTLQVSTGAEASLLEVDSGAVAWRPTGGSERVVAAGSYALAGVDVGLGRVILVRPGLAPTLAEACAAAQPGDRILLAEGVHSAGGDDQRLAALTTSGTSAAPIRIGAAPAARPRLRSAAWNALELSGVTQVVVSGLEFEPAPGTRIAGNGIFAEDCREIVVADCTFTGLGGEGLGIVGSQQVNLRDLLVRECAGISPYGQGGLSIQARRDGGIVVRPAWRIRVERVRSERNRCTADNQATGARTGGHGLLLTGLGLPADAPPGSGVVIEDLVATGNDGPGLALLDCAQVDVIRAILRANGQAAIHDNPSEAVGVRTIGLTFTDCLFVPAPGRAPWRGDHEPSGGFPGSAWSGDGADIPGLRRLAAEPQRWPLQP